MRNFYDPMVFCLWVKHGMFLNHLIIVLNSSCCWLATKYSLVIHARVVIVTRSPHAVTRRLETRTVEAS
ncbi:hypothetical protein L1987_43469 [Smallanthus sonchifolius]|uniref:Uncharacterized protein n=1 Tax=Smallanthus sonchifolius TaxID=185202 RepID=A0ACB9GMZ4_9ASTR|nr:hypothetical protein L1987_43469 [Smallanthus sonchifolius]